MGIHLITMKGRELLKVIRDKNYTFLSIGSTMYWQMDVHKMPDLLDFFIANGISTIYIQIMSSYDLTSDDSPIIITISTTVIYRNDPPQLHNS
jgi:hypothetical protein